MRAISLFSGAGGFELGFQRAGIETMLQAESDPVCLSVLARHWPETERVDDVRNVGAEGQGVWRNGRDDARWRRIHAEREPILRGVDLVYGGFPCQDLSVAGKRAGFGGERSSLWFEFERVLRELRPRWTVIENVPGLLSSGSQPGADFGVLLRGLVDLGYGVAWRVLDARWFGVPQRRRRVFVVGCLGDAQRAAQVLAVCESCGGHSPQSREEGQGIAAEANGSTGVAGTLYAKYGKTHGTGGDDIDRGLGLLTMVADPISTREGKTWTHEGSNNFRTHNLVDVASPVRASDGHHGYSSGRGDGADNLIAWDDRNHKAEQDTHHTLRGAGLQRSDVMASMAGVRRLTPLECERLMGWPDEHTRYAADGHQIPDSHRYRLCGNGVVATVAEWIGHRLVVAHAWQTYD